MVGGSTWHPIAGQISPTGSKLSITDTEIDAESRQSQLNVLYYNWYLTQSQLQVKYLKFMKTW